MRTRTPERTAEQVVDQLLREHGDQLDLDLVAAELDRRRRLEPVSRLMEVWSLSLADVAAMFSVSRQAVAKWVGLGVPAERAPAIADLDAATELLLRYLRRERIPAVVRRPAPALDGHSLLELATSGRTAEVLAATRAMFAFEAANG
ncbi:MAG: hypothetical protein U0Q03_22985 [Acidimicrobiales bacterium]